MSIAGSRITHRLDPEVEAAEDEAEDKEAEKKKAVAEEEDEEEEEEKKETIYDRFGKILGREKK